MLTFSRYYIPLLAVLLGTYAQASVITVNIGRWTPDTSQTMAVANPNASSANASLRGFRMTLPGGAQTLAFCIELGQGISSANNGAFTFENANSLSLSARGSGTFNGTPGAGTGANIQTGVGGGIGDLRAARIRYLFDTYWESNTATSWTNPTVRIPAMQLAIWELTHDTGFSLLDDTGRTTDFFAGFPPSPGTLRDVHTYATTMLDTVNNAGVLSTYASRFWMPRLLENSAFTPGVTLFNNANVQDLVYATAIPEPSTAAACTAALTLIFIGLRRRGKRARPTLNSAVQG